MKIAVTSTGGTSDSLVDPRFGRAGFFVIYDTESGEYRAIDNSVNSASAQGAGVRSGEVISDNGIDVVISGHVGPKAHRVLSAAGVRTVVAGQGVTVDQALKSFMAGELEEIDGPDVEGHWK